MDKKKRGSSVCRIERETELYFTPARPGCGHMAAVAAKG